MSRWKKIAVLAVLIVVFGIQFIRVERTNPPIVAAQAIDAHVTVSGDIGLIFARSCNDCHSHKTIYPWYFQVAPVSWWVRDHVDHGRSHFNMSEWGSYDKTKQARRLEEICEEVRSGRMPLPSYLWGHRDAVLSDADKEAICSWTDAERAKLLTTASE